MKIDKEKLINLLVEKTSSEREEIRNQLDQLIERILDAAKRGKALEIKEFGEFYFDEGGELKFNPAEELSTEISFKYAGMKPVELNPERHTSVADFEEKTDDELLEEEGYEFDESTGTADEEKEVFSDDDLTPAEEENKNKTINPVFRQPVRKRNDNTGVLILAIIILFAILIGGYFYYTDMQNQSLNEQPEPAENQTESGIVESQISGIGIDEDATEPEIENESIPASDQEMADNSPASSEQAGSEEISDNEIAPDDGATITEDDQSAYGLMGSVVDLDETNYSIVLHSFDTEDRAISAAEQLREDGYRVKVSSRTVYENIVWRVSVGQFQSLADAQQAATLLPNPYNTQNFIQRNTD